VLSSLQAYSHFIYTLQDRYPSIRSSTLIVISLGTTMGSLRGTLEFGGGITLRAVEEIDFQAQRIEYYSYSVMRQDEELYRYDPQPHPHVPELQPTHPHHKHVPPDIKHHRVPAPGLGFSQPNLPFLIEEIERILLITSKGTD